MSNFTVFSDMHSGGNQKLHYPLIVIEAPEEEAILVFKQVFGRDPDHVTCNCCGKDYAIYADEESLEQATGFWRRCAWDSKAGRYIEAPGTFASYDYMPLDQFILSGKVKILLASDVMKVMGK